MHLSSRIKPPSGGPEVTACIYLVANDVNTEAPRYCYVKMHPGIREAECLGTTVLVDVVGHMDTLSCVVVRELLAVWMCKPVIYIGYA